MTEADPEPERFLIPKIPLHKLDIDRPFHRPDKTRSWLLRRVTLTRTSQGSMFDPVEVSRLERAHKALCRSLTGKDQVTGLVWLSFHWQLVYLQRRAAEVWNSLIVPVIAGITPPSSENEISVKIALYTVFAQLADCVLSDGEVSLAGMVDHLRKQGLLHNGEQMLALQLVFQMTGWLTALWDPVPSERNDVLRLTSVGMPHRRTGVLHDPAVKNTEAPAEEVGYQQLYHMASRFGNLFPLAEFCLDDDTLGNRDAESACLNTAYLSLHNLQDLVGIKLKWTETLSQHLEYHPKHKELYVFKNPSICLTAFREHGGCLLSKVFESQRVGLSENKRYPALNKVGFEEYLVEVILSYRLIFGLQQRSRERIAHLLPSKSGYSSSSNDCDPLLMTLCTADESVEAVKLLYELLEVEEFENYVPISEYPFLATRLIQLQRVSMGRNPHSFRRLWNDRRDPAAWFALWLVLIIGGGTLLFGLVQMVFQIYQAFQKN